MDLDELSLGEQAACHRTLGAERRDKGSQHNQASVDHQLGRFGNTADVLYSVGFGETEVAAKAVAHVVAVEQVGMAAASVQLLVDQVGDRRLARAREARKPQYCWPLVL